MDLSEFGQELKKLRLDKQVSLMDISFSTRINIKFLEAIEEGKFSVLPQTYVRAFLKEYGEAVGIGTEEILGKYDAIREPKAASVSKEATISAPPSPPQNPRTPAPKRREGSLALKKNILFAGVLVVGAALFFVLRSPSVKSPTETQEVPFDAVVKESEASTFKPDTFASVVLPPPVLQPDSLHLEMATTDSVWISILVDGKTTLEYLFPPDRKRTFNAKDQFLITIGNAGGATFRLNGKELGTLGKRGAVVRNVLINGARLKGL